MDTRQRLEFAKTVRRLYETYYDKRISSVILHDCVIDEITVKDGKICISFSTSGVYAWVETKKNHYRTGPAMVEILGCDIDNIEIQEIRMNQISQKIFYRSMYEIKPLAFVKLVNLKKIKATVLEEYYAVNSAYLVLRIKECDQKGYFAHIKIQYASLQYSWDYVRQAAPF